jgi:hypothetical protein
MHAARTTTPREIPGYVSVTGMEGVFEKGQLGRGQVTNINQNRKSSSEGGSDTNTNQNQQERLGRGQATPIQTKTNKTPSAPPQVPSPCCIGIHTSAQLNSCGAWDLRGRARGLVGFGLYWCRLPLPDCSFDFGFAPSQLSFFCFSKLTS